ncbi:MAG TPA: xanthine dehydrogenase family protein subunit M [Anaerolineae bacterium]|nr:xanthine dehydrogenase family protein subunit M [Anaerolineae bacterium]
MYNANFDYHRPSTVAEAVQLLGTHPEAKVLAGGHSLLPAMKLRTATPLALIDIGRIKELAGVRLAGQALEIGAMTTHATLAGSDVVKTHCPILAEAAAQIGDTQVRNRGTIGGSLAHADPAADLPTLMLALEATLTATGPKGKREIAATDCFVGLFTTALEPGELLTSIRVPVYSSGTGGAYLKHRHPASSYAVVGVAALVSVKGGKCENVRLAIGGVAHHSIRCEAAEQALNGQPANEAAISAAAAKVAGAFHEPLHDVYASGEYRIHLAQVMAQRALLKAVERARG